MKNKTLRKKLQELIATYPRTEAWHFRTKLALAVNPKYILVYKSKAQLSPQQISALSKACKEVLNRDLRFTLQLLP